MCAGFLNSFSSRIGCKKKSRGGGWLSQVYLKMVIKTEVVIPIFNSFILVESRGIVEAIVITLYLADCQCCHGERQRYAGTSVDRCTSVFSWTPCCDQRTLEHCSRLVVYRNIGRRVSGCHAES